MRKRTRQESNALREIEYKTFGGIADGKEFLDYSMIDTFKDLKGTLYNPFLDEWDQDINFDEMEFIRYYSSYLEYMLVKFPEPQHDFEAYYGVIVSQFDGKPSVNPVL